MKRLLSGVALGTALGVRVLVGLGGLSGRPLERLVAQLSTSSARDSALDVVLTSLVSTPIDRLPCAPQAPLTAHVRPGDAWDRHRHWLELDRAYTYDHSAYRIGNLRTGVAYQWGY